MTDKTRHDEVSSKTPSSKLGKWLFYFGVLFLIGITTDWFTYAWEQTVSSKVTSRPIGNLVRITPAGGFLRDALVETEQGFFPAIGFITAAKGTPLVLETRAWGDRFICDVPRTLCVHTADTGFEVVVPSAAVSRAGLTNRVSDLHESSEKAAE